MLVPRGNCLSISLFLSFDFLYLIIGELQCLHWQSPQRATLPFYISWHSSKSPCTADLIPAFLPFYVFPYFHPYVSFYVGDGNPPPFILKPENHPHRLLHRIHPLHSFWNQVALHHELSEYFRVLPQFLYFRYCYMRKK